MGTWAVGSFESDHALEWLTKLYESGDFGLVRTALSGDFEHADPSAARRAIAAADLVACSLGHPPSEPKRKDLVKWTQQHPDAFTPELLELARSAVKTIKTRSKLRDLWKKRDGSVDPAWLASMAHLEGRLET